jgi:exopolysaccharide production protein ExoQ
MITKIDKYNRKSIYSKAAKFAFVVFLFFAFFGTALPFQEEIESADEIGTSNIINQLSYSSLFLISLFSLLPKRKEILLLIKKEKVFTAFLIWCFITIIWSDFKFVSFKRLFQIITITMVSTTALFYIDSDSRLIKYFKAILYPYLIISLISVFIIPGALDHSFGSWRGLASSKNHLGQISLISIMLCFIALRTDKTLKNKLISLLMLFISITLLAGTRSTTSLLVFIFLLSVATLLMIEKQFKQLGVGYTFSFVVISAFLVILISVALNAPNYISAVPNAFGKDMTFTGRITLWQEMLLEISQHPIIGTGFQSFWVMSNYKLMNLYEKFVWLPLQAHNGYLDILNEVGVIGLTLVILMVIFYFTNLHKLRNQLPWFLFIITVLIINFQETTLFRTGHISGMFFIFAYLTLYVRLVLIKNQVSVSST